MSIDPLMFGKEIGALIRDAVSPLEQRIAALEAAMAGFDAAEIDRVAESILAGEDQDV